jgi:hypothetical protein
MHLSIQGVSLLGVSWRCKRLTLALTLTSKNQAGPKWRYMRVSIWDEMKTKLKKQIIYFIYSTNKKTCNYTPIPPTHTTGAGYGGMQLISTVRSFHTNPFPTVVKGGMVHRKSPLQLICWITADRDFNGARGSSGFPRRSRRPRRSEVQGCVVVGGQQVGQANGTTLKEVKNPRSTIGLSACVCIYFM